MDVTWYKGGVIYYPKKVEDVNYCYQRDIIPYFIDGGCIPANLINYLNQYIDGKGIVEDKYLYNFDKLVEDNLVYNVYTNNLEPKDIYNNDIFRLYNIQIKNQGITLIFSYNTIAGHERYLPPEFQTQKPMPIHVEVVNTIKSIQDIGSNILTRSNNLLNISEGLDKDIKSATTFTDNSLTEIINKLPQVGAAMDIATYGVSGLSPVAAKVLANYQISSTQRKVERVNTQQEIQKNVQEFDTKRREILDKLDHLRLIVDTIKAK